MKTLTLGLLALVASAFTDYRVPSHKPVDGYDVQLLSKDQVGSNYEWVWKVTNLEPGNGTDGTLQDMSHWALVPNACMTQADIVGSFYSLDGLSWQPLTALIAVDPSQSCYTQPVLKFNHGLDGAEPVYFKLVVNKPFNSGYTQAVFKSGKRLPCYIGMIEGIVCEEIPNR